MMQLLIFLTVALAVLSVACRAAAAGASVPSASCSALLAKTDPRVGSGGLGYGYGSINPGASVPRGVLRLGPDTTLKASNLAFQHFSGYDSLDDKVRMFSHTHFVGAGINGLGSFGLMPAEISVKKLALKRKGLSLLDGESARAYEAWRALAEWHSPFDKASEEASPGSYGVFLDDPQVQVDVVATGGFSARHRYTFKGDPTRGLSRAVFLNVCHASHAEMELPLSKSNCKLAALTVHADGSFDAQVHDSKNKYDLFLHGEVLAADATGRAADPASWLACGTHHRSQYRRGTVVPVCTARSRQPAQLRCLSGWSQKQLCAGAGQRAKRLVCAVGVLASGYGH
jgi:putative alpha-1,2-mannosidase